MFNSILTLLFVQLFHPKLYIIIGLDGYKNTRCSFFCFQLDCCDQLHIDGIAKQDQSYEIESVVEILVGLIKQGKIKQIGFSEISPTSLARTAAIYPIAAVQSEYSLSTRPPEMGLVQKLKKLELR